MGKGGAADNNPNKVYDDGVGVEVPDTAHQISSGS